MTNFRQDIMDILVYRLTEERYHKELQNVKDEFYSGKEAFYEENKREKLRADACLIKRFGGMWEYNEIIGFIKLHRFGHQIRGDFYCNDVKKHRKTRKKQFEFLTHNLALEVDLESNANDSIFRIIQSYLDNCKHELGKKRFVDDRHFRQLGSYIDWNSYFAQKQ